jgi:transposase
VLVYWRNRLRTSPRPRTEPQVRGLRGVGMPGFEPHQPVPGRLAASTTVRVARQNVSRWHAQWQSGGLEALRSADPTGPIPRLSDAQLAAIDQALRQGARAHGFDSDHWTLARVATVIEQVTGVVCHPGHVWKLLRHRLHYRLLRPARRAVER